MPRRSSPEALGSPTGSIVRPDHRLLRPHLRLSIPPATLWIMQPVFTLRSAPGWVREGPQFTLCVYALRAVFRTPMDCAVAFGCFFTAHADLRRICTGSASIAPRSTVLAWLCNEAAKFPLWYGPMSLLALHRQGRLRSSFHLLSHPTETSNILRGQTANFPRPDFPTTGLSGKTHSLMGCEQMHTESI